MAKKTKRKTHRSLKSAMGAVKARRPRAAGHARSKAQTHGSDVAQETLAVERIKIGKRHRKAYGDIASLARSIDARGALLQPIVITAKNELIAGDRRIRAWKQSKFAGQPIPVHRVDIDAIIAGEWDENAERKNFEPSEAVAIKREIEKRLKALAKARQQAGAPADAAQKGRAGDQAARFTGRARRSLEKAEAVVDAAKQDPQRFGRLKADMDRTGRVDGPFRRLMIMQQTDALKKAPPPLPMRGPYMTMVVDFPVTGDRDKDQETIDAQGRSFRGYPEMSIEECCKFARAKLAPILAPDCSVWLTFPNFHIVHGDAHRICKAFGEEFKPATMLTWKKDRLGRGQILRDQTEHAIVIYRGKPVFNVLGEQPPTTFLDGIRREGSRKPDELFALVERVAPSPRYAEIFSRGGRGENWDCHGDEVGKFSPDVPKEKQAEILAPVSKTEDEIKLDILEAIAAGQQPDLRLLDSKLMAALDRCVEGKNKLKLNAEGKRALDELRAGRDFRALQAQLPDDRTALGARFLDALQQQHAAILAKDKALTQHCARQLDAIAAKLDGADRVPDWRRCAQQPPIDFAAPVGTVPLWGQPGLFVVQVDDLPVLVKADHDGNFDLFAVDPDQPFLDADGVSQCGNVSIGTDDSFYGWDEFAGLTVDRYVIAELRAEIDLRAPKKGKKPLYNRPLSTPPAFVYALPPSWDGESDPPKTNAGKAKAAKKGKAAAGAPAPKTVPQAAADAAAAAAAPEGSGAGKASAAPAGAANPADDQLDIPGYLRRAGAPPAEAAE